MFDQFVQLYLPHTQPKPCFISHKKSTKSGKNIQKSYILYLHEQKCQLFDPYWVYRL